MKKSITGITGKSHSLGIHGMGGIGKTVIANMIANDPDVQKMFPDGILWIAFGQQPNVVELLNTITKAFKLSVPEIIDSHKGKTTLQKELEGKKFLLILDDVWKHDHLRPFHNLSNNSKILVTSRNTEIVRRIGGIEYRLDILSEEDAFTLISRWIEITDDNKPFALKINKECG